MSTSLLGDSPGGEGGGQGQRYRGRKGKVVTLLLLVVFGLVV